MDVIIYETKNGNVAVCWPSGEVPIAEVLKKDAPAHAKVVKADTLPWKDQEFFDAWRLKDGKVVVDLDRAKEVKVQDAHADNLQKVARGEITRDEAVAKTAAMRETLKELQSLDEVKAGKKKDPKPSGK